MNIIKVSRFSNNKNKISISEYCNKNNKSFTILPDEIKDKLREYTPKYVTHIGIYTLLLIDDCQYINKFGIKAYSKYISVSDNTLRTVLKDLQKLNLIEISISEDNKNKKVIDITFQDNNIESSLNEEESAQICAESAQIRELPPPELPNSNEIPECSNNSYNNIYNNNIKINNHTKEKKMEKKNMKNEQYEYYLSKIKELYIYNQKEKEERLFIDTIYSYENKEYVISTLQYILYRLVTKKHLNDIRKNFNKTYLKINDYDYKDFINFKYKLESEYDKYVRMKDEIEYEKKQLYYNNWIETHTETEIKELDEKVMHYLKYIKKLSNQMLNRLNEYHIKIYRANYLYTGEFEDARFTKTFSGN